MKDKYCHISCYKLFFTPLLLFVSIYCGFSQTIVNQHRIYFISDVQTPLRTEKIILKPYKNTEARDSLFSDIILQHPENLFMLGDLTSKGSDEKAWKPLDDFLNSLKKINTNVNAIPGNHEYLSKTSGSIYMFEHRFHKEMVIGYSVNFDSVAIVMLNSNFNNMTEGELSKQLKWYKSEINSLDSDQAIKAIIVCTHHAPYSNSKIVGSSEPVENMFVPVFVKSQKSKLFISGHSHNLEYFSETPGKYFLVIGGGGGLTQPLISVNKRNYHDLLEQDTKPLYFYLIIEIERNDLKLIARGFKKDFRFFDLDIGIIPVNHN